MVGIKAIGFKPFLSNLSKVKKKSEQFKKLLAMVRVTGLEPVRQRHTPLKRACLPIPAHSHNFSQREILYHNELRMSIQILKKTIFFGAVRFPPRFLLFFKQ